MFPTKTIQIIQHEQPGYSTASGALLVLLGIMLASSLALTACGDDDNPEPSSGAGKGELRQDAGPSETGPGASVGNPSPGCENGELSAGDHNVDSPVASDEGPRTYLLHIPDDGDEPMPLVINMHGFLSNAEQQWLITDMNVLADHEGLVVAYPQGLGAPLSAWDAGVCCVFDGSDRDDVGFIAAVLDDIADKTCVDLDRVYATGFSNGGILSYRIACELSDRFAAIAPVSGVLGIPPEDCKPERVLPVLHFHGTGDAIVPYAGGKPAGFELIFPATAPPTLPSVADTVAAYRKLADCPTEVEVTYEQGAAKCETTCGCGADGSGDVGVEVTLCTIDQGGHTWPGGDPDKLDEAFGLFRDVLGAATADIDANEMMWEFFSRYSLGGD